MPAADAMQVSPAFEQAVRHLNLSAWAVFDRADIIAWRKLPDRENCTLRFEFQGQQHLWHIKRCTHASMALNEVTGMQHLAKAGIPCPQLVAYGQLTDGRGFVITQDLTGYVAGDKLLRSAKVSFDELLQPTAHLAAKLHNAKLHHRDLYVCHYFIRAGEAAGQVPDLALIDCARVRPLPWLFARRWVIKDLAQFLYSLGQEGVAEAQQSAWLGEYLQARGQPGLLPAYQKLTAAKVRRIAAHDVQLRKAQPNRNISIT